jgi:hypothetical protein
MVAGFTPRLATLDHLSVAGVRQRYRISSEGLGGRHATLGRYI